MTKIKSNQIAETPKNWVGKSICSVILDRNRFSLPWRFRERVGVLELGLGFQEEEEGEERRREGGGEGGWRRRRWYSISTTLLIVAQRRRTTPLFRSTRSSRTVLASVAFSTVPCRFFSLFEFICFHLFAWFFQFMFIFNCFGVLCFFIFFVLCLFCRCGWDLKCGFSLWLNTSAVFMIWNWVLCLVEFHSVEYECGKVVAQWEKEFHINWYGNWSPFYMDLGFWFLWSNVSVVLWSTKYGLFLEVYQLIVFDVARKCFQWTRYGLYVGFDISKAVLVRMRVGIWWRYGCAGVANCLTI